MCPVCQHLKIWPAAGRAARCEARVERQEGGRGILHKTPHRSVNVDDGGRSAGAGVGLIVY